MVRQNDGWTIGTLKELVDAKFAALDVAHRDLQNMLQERYATQTKALDAAFLAQQTAMRTALEAAEKAVQTALVSAEKAVGKAEVAAEKRFESVNEFRAQLTDQAASFLTRNEGGARLDALADKLEAETARTSARLQEMELRLTERINALTTSRALAEGQDMGSASSRTERRLDVGQALMALSVLVGAVGLIIAAAVFSR